MATKTRVGGYRISDGARVGRVRLAVSDLERSLEFYVGVIGFEVLERRETGASLGVKGSRWVLLELEERAGLAPLRGRRLGLYHFAVLLPSRVTLGAFAVHLGRLGVRAGASDHLVSEAFYLVDPDGLEVEVYADRKRSQWPRVDGHLRMAVDPLDVEGLVRSAAGVIWDGSPVGTTIGHMHFFVGDLEAGRAFYQAGLGMDLMVAYQDAALFLSAGGYHHHVGINVWARGSEVAGEGDPRLLDWELVVPAEEDVRSVAGSLREAGFVAVDGEGVQFRDAWGIEVKVVPE
jgi:catechol 2,3-dioxygenase